jgi:hypothetical protein
MSIEETITEHLTLANGPSECVCACDSTWRTHGDYRTHLAEALTAAGYRKPRTATEIGIVFNGHASMLNPPAMSLEEFKERYERETGWMITDRDVYIQRTFQVVNPSPSDWELHTPEPQS